jgi:hypothetical protein
MRLARICQQQFARVRRDNRCKNLPDDGGNGIFVGRHLERVVQLRAKALAGGLQVLNALDLCHPRALAAQRSVEWSEEKHGESNQRDDGANREPVVRTPELRQSVIDLGWARRRSPRLGKSVPVAHPIDGHQDEPDDDPRHPAHCEATLQSTELTTSCGPWGF